MQEKKSSLLEKLPKSRLAFFSAMNDFAERHRDKYYGNTKAMQTILAVRRLLSGWFNDMDVFDNANNDSGLGFMNDISSYANWLDQNTCCSHLFENFCQGKYADLSDNPEYQYDYLMVDLANFFTEEILKEYMLVDTIGDIAKTTGKYRYE